MGLEGPPSNQERGDQDYSVEYFDVEDSSIGNIQFSLGEEQSYQTTENNSVRCRNLEGLNFTNSEGKKVDLIEATGITKVKDPVSILIAEDQHIESQYFHENKTIIVPKPNTAHDMSLLLHRIAQAKQAQEDPKIKKIYDLNVMKAPMPVNKLSEYQQYKKQLTKISDAIPELFTDEEREQTTQYSQLVDKYTDDKSRLAWASLYHDKIEKQWDELQRAGVFQQINSLLTGERREKFIEWRDATKRWLDADIATVETSMNIDQQLKVMGDTVTASLSDKAIQHIQKEASGQVNKWYNELGNDAAIKIRLSVLGSYRSALLKEQLDAKQRQANNFFQKMLNQMEEDRLSRQKFLEEGGIFKSK